MVVLGFLRFGTSNGPLPSRQEAVLLREVGLSTSSCTQRRVTVCFGKAISALLS
jgi:hypothetical protein